MQRNLLTWLLTTAALFSATGLASAGDLTVSAASSLTNVFREIAQSYKERYPDAKIALNFGASGALLQQLAKGAPVDVFASADQETMDLAEKQGLVARSDRQDFVRNLLVLIALHDARFSIGRLQDLAQPGVKRIAMGNPASVPAGRYARLALEAASVLTIVEAKTITTHTVRQALDYVARGEVDAGFVYATDAVLMKDKVKVAFDVPLDRAITYPIAKTMASTNSEEARRFIRFILAPAGQAILHNHGFRKL